MIDMEVTNRTGNQAIIHNLTEAYTSLVKVTKVGVESEYIQYAQQKADSLQFFIRKLANEMQANEEDIDSELVTHMLNGWI